MYIFYGVFEELDIITRAAVVENRTEGDIQLFKDSIKKMYIDFFNSIFQNDLQCLSF